MPPARPVRRRVETVFPTVKVERIPVALKNEQAEDEKTIASMSSSMSLSTDIDTDKLKAMFHSTPKSTAKTSSTFRPSPNTDLVLRAGDVSYEFHVSSKVLFKASPVLADKIKALGHGKPVSVVEVGGSEVVIQLDEEAEVIDAILRYAYPKAKPPVVRSIEHLEKLLAACHRYKVEAGRHALGQLVITHAEKTPLTAYAIACRHELFDEARIISKYTLGVDLSKADLAFDFVGVPAANIRRLVQLHSTRASEAEILIDECRDADFHCRGCQGVAEWFVVFREAAKIELRLKPNTEEAFSLRFLAGCLRRASKTCGYCVDNYMSFKAQLALSVLKSDIDALNDRI